MIHTANTQDDTLRRDVAILSTLAQLHCATIPQLYALCSPNHTLTTVRTSLFYLAEAHCIAHSTWRVRGLTRERGQVWVLTAKGHETLRRYSPHFPPLACIDLGRPSTALEYEEWRVRIWIRTMLVRFLLHARYTSFLNRLEFQLPWNPSDLVPSKPTLPPEPDATVLVVWHPAERQPNDWLPWLVPLPASQSVSQSVVCYPIFVERTHARIDIASLVSSWSATSIPSHYVPLVILQDEARSAEVHTQVSMLPAASSIRIVTRTALEGDTGPERFSNGYSHLEFLSLLPIEAAS
jgi:hypothetical protein